MICVSINNPSPERCAALFESLRPQMAEIRLDSAELSTAQIRAIFALPIPLIATCRPTPNRTETQRQEILVTAIQAGAAYVDIEIEMGFNSQFAMIIAARDTGCKVIASYHNFECTPPTARLELIVRHCFSSGADIAKIACLAQNREDCARLLSLYAVDFDQFDLVKPSSRKIVLIAMGELGKITRVAAPLLGAPFTFAAPEPSQETAPGQLTHETLKSIYELLK